MINHGSVEQLVYEQRKVLPFKYHTGRHPFLDGTATKIRKVLHAREKIDLPYCPSSVAASSNTC